MSFPHISVFLKIFRFSGLAKMQQVLLFLLGAHLAYAGTHSLRYFYTAVSGDIDFPEFTAVGLVDGGQFIYFDSKKMEAVPKTEWIRQNEGADYWDSQTQGLIGAHQNFKNNIQVAKERFNQSQGVHTNQRMYGCEWDDQTGTINGFFQDGYDGEDFLSLDFKEMRYISPVPQGVITTQKWNNDKANLDYWKNYLSTECVEWLQKYLQYGKSSLQKTVSPQVSLLQKSSSSFVCLATGFYPSGIKISWQRNEQDHDEDVDLGELLPNEDGTFQKTSTLKVNSDELKSNKFTCVVEHHGEIKTRAIEDSVSVGLIAGIAVAVLLVIVIAVTGFMMYRKKKGYKPANSSDDGSRSSAQDGPQA